MNIETLELIHKLLTEHKDNASRCCDRARGKRNSTPDDDQNYERYDMKLREADKAKFAAQDAESCGDPIAVAEIYQHGSSGGKSRAGGAGASQGQGGRRCEGHSHLPRRDSLG